RRSLGTVAVMPWAFESGDIDYATYKYDNLGNVEGYDNVYVNTEISALQYYVTPNCAKPPFDDLRVRQALCYAMDREEVGMIACNGGGVVAWSMVSATLKDFRDVNEHLDNDPDKARQLMTEAGYSASNPAQVVMICKDWSLPVMEVLQERLEQCYFECHIEMVSDSTRMWAGDFNLNCNQLILNSVQGYSALFDPDNFCTSHYVDLDLAHRIQSAQTEEELIAVQKEMNDTLAYIAICQPAQFFAIDSDLEIVADGDENPYGGLDYTLRCLRWKN
ncbi:MAG: hypothetical protein II689_02390, partial [Firmicutes bacterium]|nr:hypothetical protein [Bacillota bacterium]